MSKLYFFEGDADFNPEAPKVADLENATDLSPFVITQEFKIGDKVVVAGHRVSMFNGHEGWIVAIKPSSSSFYYHVKLGYNGSIFGFNRDELKPAE